MPESPASDRPPEWTDGLPPCTDCGFCCFFPDPRYVMVFESDLERLGARAAELTFEVGGRVFLRSVDGHCVALRQDGERFLCSIYEQRPSLCREFERGNETCQDTVVRRHPRVRRPRAVLTPR
jgi:uncharacterized protein